MSGNGEAGKNSDAVRGGETHESVSRSLVAAQEQLPEIFRMDQNKALAVLSGSHYPGAKPESVALVLDYCRAAGLNPMLKPVHVVSMKISTGEKDADGWDIKEDRDIIMPGVGHYRTQASRNSQYAGKSEPEFGPIRTLEYEVDVYSGYGKNRTKSKEKRTLEYPEWCKIVVKKRFSDGYIGEWTAIEYWLENYATKGNGNAPNSMWTKRPRGQLAKCTEAQALRMAFPELGAAPTAEEMEGKQISAGGHVIDADTGEIEEYKQGSLMPKEKAGAQGEVVDAEFAEGLEGLESPGDFPPETDQETTQVQTQDKPKEEAKRASAATQEAKGATATNGKAASAGQIKMIRSKLGRQDQIDETGLCHDWHIDKLESLPADKVNEVIKHLEGLASGG